MYSTKYLLKIWVVDFCFRLRVSIWWLGSSVADWRWAVYGVWGSCRRGSSGGRRRQPVRRQLQAARPPPDTVHKCYLRDVAEVQRVEGKPQLQTLVQVIHRQQHAGLVGIQRLGKKARDQVEYDQGCQRSRDRSSTKSHQTGSKPSEFLNLDVTTTNHF